MRQCFFATAAKRGIGITNVLKLRCGNPQIAEQGAVVCTQIERANRIRRSIAILAIRRRCDGDNWCAHWRHASVLSVAEVHRRYFRFQNEIKIG